VVLRHVEEGQCLEGRQRPQVTECVVEQYKGGEVGCGDLGDGVDEVVREVQDLDTREGEAGHGHDGVAGQVEVLEAVEAGDRPGDLGEFVVGYGHGYQVGCGAESSCRHRCQLVVGKV
jgi:hypothetical protein